MEQDRDYRDIIGGLAVLFIGLGIAVHAGINLQLGSLDRMGPGMFPFGVGILTAVCGAVICIPGFSRTGVLPKLAIRPGVIILASIVGFSLIVQNFGFIPAIFFQVLLSGLASQDSKLKQSLLLSVGLCIAVYFIFVLGLGLRIPVLNWPL